MCAGPSRQFKLSQCLSNQRRAGSQLQLVHLQIDTLVGHLYEVDHRRPQNNICHTQRAEQLRIDNASCTCDFELSRR